MHESDVVRISVPEAARLIAEEGYQHIDVRSPAEFAAGHAVNSVNIPLLVPGPMGRVHNPRFLEVFEALYPPDTKLVISCQSGRRSLVGTLNLMTAGWQHVVEMRAGYGGLRNAFGTLREAGWCDAELPTTTESPENTYEALLARVATQADG